MPCSQFGLCARDGWPQCLWRRSWYAWLMRRRLLSLFTASIIFLMVLPPIFNAFDRWDTGPELPLVGHDTETTLMMAAMDVGLGVAVAWGAVCLLSWLAAVLLPGIIATARVHTHRGVRATEYLILLFSPPWRTVSLRI